MLCGGSDAAIIPIGIIHHLIFVVCLTESIKSCTERSSHIVIVAAGLGGFVACRSLSQRNSHPAKASRPWDIVLAFHNLLCFLCIFFSSKGFRNVHKDLSRLFFKDSIKLCFLEAGRKC